MKKLSFVTGLESVNGDLLWDVFKNYIEVLYFAGAIEKLDKRLISFEFENYIAYYLN